MIQKYIYKKKYLWLTILLFIIGLILRIWIGVLNKSGDLNNHIVWSDDFLNFGSIGFYEREFIKRRLVVAPNYPPLIIYFFVISEWLFKQVQQLVWLLNLRIPIFPSNLIYIFQQRVTYELFYKLPAITADLGIAYLLYKIARDKYPQRYMYRFLAIILVLFNPVFFYNSAYWGQVDAIPLFFILLGFYSFFFQKRKLLAIFFVSSSLLVKQTMIVFLPIWFIIWMKQYSLKMKFISGGIFFLMFYLFFLPFHKNYWDIVYPFRVYITRILLVSGQTHVTNHAFNFWYIITMGKSIEDVREFLFSFSYRTWGYLLAGIPVFFLCYIFIKKKLTLTSVLYTSVLLPFLTFLFLTRMHERHFLSVIPFLIILYFYTGKYLRWIWYVSFFHFINLYHGWWQPEPPFIEVLKIIMSQWSLITLTILMNAFICFQIARNFFRSSTST